MHPMWREVQSPRHRVLCHHLFNASALPEMWKHKNTPGKFVHKNTPGKFVRESDERGLSGDLGEDGRKEIKNKYICYEKVD